LEALGGHIEDKLVGSDGMGGGKEAAVVGGGEGRDVVAKNLDKLWWVSRRVPAGQSLGIYGGKFVVGLGVAVGDATGGISDGSEEGYEESGER
jgi:hypothetical protein